MADFWLESSSPWEESRHSRQDLERPHHHAITTKSLCWKKWRSCKNAPYTGQRNRCDDDDDTTAADSWFTKTETQLFTSLFSLHATAWATDSSKWRSCEKQLLFLLFWAGITILDQKKIVSLLMIHKKKENLSEINNLEKRHKAEN